MQNLYLMSANFENIFERYQECIEEGDEEGAAIFDKTLTDMAGDISNKMEYMVKRVKNLEAEAKMLKEEEDKLKARRQSCENGAKRLKEDMQNAMESMGLDKMNAGMFKLSTPFAGGKAPLICDDIENVPMEYIITEYKVDNEKIREALANGEALDFAYLGERKRSLRIK